jgi:hypothetical protein
MHRLLRLIRVLARWRRLALLVCLLALAMVSIHVAPTPWSLVRLRAVTNGVSILDMEAHYSGADAYRRLVALGETGRRFYLWRILGGLDVVLPVLMALTLSVAIRTALGAGVAGGDRRERWVWIPWMGAAFDYLENVLIAFLLLSFPTSHDNVGAVAGWVTSAKLVAYVVSMIVAVVLGCRAVMSAGAEREAGRGTAAPRPR